MSLIKHDLDLGIIIRRCLFLVVLIALTLGNLFVMFRGLSSPQAMDQAQIAREMARGNGQSTKFIRPADLYLARQKSDGAATISGLKDTYHAPLNLWVNSVVFKMIGADDPDAYPMAQNEMVFHLDRVVATVSTIFFLLAIGVNYLLIARIFDAKIAGVCAFIMLFSNGLWMYSLSGLPQMLMLLLFSCALYFVYRAIEAVQDQRSAMLPALMAGVFFTLLAMTHWVAVWIALGYILFAAIAFRPRGAVGVAIMVLLLVVGSIFIARNYQITGQPFGTAFITRANGVGYDTELEVMRHFETYNPKYDFKGLILWVARAVMSQIGQIVPLLAGIIVAPLFFIVLLHPFKNANIGMLRWAVLSMWAMGVLGLAFFGVADEGLDPNQIHLLFAPVMAAYGVAFISILWSRLDWVVQIPILRNAHLIVIGAICALPLLLELPRQVILGFDKRELGGVPHWPPYFAPSLRSAEGGLSSQVAPDEVVFSDQPWAVAWYADRMSIWLPPTKRDFIQLENIAIEEKTPPAGILITPSSHGEHELNQAVAKYRDFAALVINGGVAKATARPDAAIGFAIHDKAPKIQEITATYSQLNPLFGLDMIFYSKPSPTP